MVCELDASGNVTAAYAYGAAGLFERYDYVAGDYTAYAFDPAGNLVERLKGTDPNSGNTDYVGDTA